MTLSYPTGIGGGLSDFVTFTPMEYRSNAEGGAKGSAPPASGAQSVTLYMPNSTPMIGNEQGWGALRGFDGPFGRDVLAAATKGAYHADKASGGINKAQLNEFGSDIESLVKKATSGLGSYASQGAVNAIASATSSNPNHLLGLARGKVYNPNVELLYEQPTFRPFTFQFDFVPKSAEESAAMNNIIRNFKAYSAPEDLKNGMFKLPYVWQVEYHIGGSGDVNQFMNRFKPAACTAVAVQANQGTDMHVSHAQDGSPIQTSISLEFMEVEIITRKDHVNAGGQGY